MASGTDFAGDVDDALHAQEIGAAQSGEHLQGLPTALSTRTERRTEDERVDRGIVRAAAGRNAPGHRRARHELG